MRLTMLGVSAALAVMALGSTAQAGYDVIPCGRASAGWYLYAGGNGTKCSFVKATYRKVRRKEGNGPLSAQFPLNVRGKKLRCHLNVGSNYEEVRCKRGSRRVILYHR